MGVISKMDVQLSIMKRDFKDRVGIFQFAFKG
jgi:hypothetical protein